MIMNPVQKGRDSRTPLNEGEFPRFLDLVKGAFLPELLFEFGGNLFEFLDN